MAKTLWGGLIGVSLLAIIPLFMHLDSQPLFVFDEGRLANNALEMAQDGHWIVTHYDGRPDLWNTKPPLMLWLQALCMKALGIDLLAVRLPSALAGLAAVIAVFVFSFRQFRSLLPAAAASLVLLTIPAYVTTHGTRTGDFDALLTLWSTLFLFQIFRWLLAEEASLRKKHIWLAMGFFTLGVLTKGIVIFIFLPGLFVFLLAARQLPAMLRQRHFYYATLASVAAIAAWYLGREYARPGYLKAVAENELGGRFLTVVEEHEGPWSFYFENFWEWEFLPWIVFIPLAIWYAVRDTSAARRLLWRFLLWNATGFLLIISFALTKLNWYAIPVFPLLSVAVGGALGLMLAQVREWPKPAGVSKGLVLFGLFLLPYVQQIKLAYQFKDTYHGWEQRLYGGFMKKVKTWPHYTVVQTDYNTHIAFYVKKYKAEGKDVAVKYPNELVPGDTILLCEERTRKAVLEQRALDELFVEKNCGLYLVKGL